VKREGDSKGKRNEYGSVKIEVWIKRRNEEKGNDERE
jgi:hypothetical protein